jgi:hypothetical protein
LSEEKVIGQQILTNVDRLIETVIATGLKDQEEYRQKFDLGCRLVMEIYNLLEQIIGPQSEYLERAVKEMVAQRIPDQRLLNGFSDFYELLDRMCQHASARNMELGDQSREEGGAAQSDKDEVERALGLLFPDTEVIRGHRDHGISFAYYLPALKIAVAETGAWEKGGALKEYQCRRDGIRVVFVDKSMAGYREIARQIRRRLLEVRS